MHNLMQELINEGDGSCFEKIFLELEPKERNKFENIILENKLSTIFLRFLNQNNIIDLIDKSFFDKCVLQKDRFQLHSLEIIKEVRLINEIFESEGLTPIYLKGISMQKEYEDIALRPLVDIDILFNKSELLRAYKILHKSNLLASDQEIFINENNLDDYCVNNYDIGLKTKNNISVELHHRVTVNNEQIKLVNCPISSCFFDDFRTINYYGTCINIPSVENMIIHQLCHFSINSDFRKLLGTLVDIKKVASNYSLDWNKIILKYENIKIRKSLCLSLDLMNLNKIYIKDFNVIKDRFYEQFPSQEILNIAQQKLFHSYSEKIKGEAFFVRFFNRGSFINALISTIFPKKEMLVYKFKLSKPTRYKLFKIYVKYLYKQILKIRGLPSFLVFKYKNKNIKYTKSIQNWLNED